jgi:hypothetical protein
MKSIGLINNSTEDLSEIMKGLLDNRGKITSSRPNNEDIKQYKPADEKSADFYARMSKRTNEIMNKSEWE